jgi:DNA-binding transcriptional MerR regulator
MARSAPRETSRKPARSPQSGRMPIEELARRTGMTVRNLRAMHARSLLPPPELVGRKGFYTERHVARVMLVLKLQSRRFSLASIEALLESWEAGSGLMDVMGLEDSLLTPGTSGSNAEADVEETFPELLADPRALAKALAQELIVERDGRYIAPDAELLDIVKQQVVAGFPLLELLEQGDVLMDDLDRIAARFRQSFFKHVVDRHLEPGNVGAGLSDIADKVARLRPLSVRLVTILLSRAIERGGGPPAVAPGRKGSRKTPASMPRGAKRANKGGR